MKYLAHAIALGTLLLLAGCNEEADAKKANPVIKEVGMIDGCRVIFVDRGYVTESFYMARCETGTSTIIGRAQNGKTTIPQTVISVAEENAKIAELDAARKLSQTKVDALNKLSDAEKAALGIK